MIDDIDTLAALAREAAFQHGDTHSYTPKSSAEAQTWIPHQWVIEAMRAAIRLNATPPPSPDAAVREAVTLTEDAAREMFCRHYLMPDVSVWTTEHWGQWGIYLTALRHARALAGGGNG